MSGHLRNFEEEGKKKLEEQGGEQARAKATAAEKIYVFLPIFQGSQLSLSHPSRQTVKTFIIASFSSSLKQRVSL